MRFYWKLESIRSIQSTLNILIIILRQLEEGWDLSLLFVEGE